MSAMQRWLRASFLAVFCLSLVLSPVKPVQAAPNTGEFSCQSVTEIPTVECEALVALYNKTLGSDWANTTNWLISNSPSTWYGVTVKSGHVEKIQLGSNNLNGVLPHEIGSLSGLVELALGGNSMLGSLPQELGDLSNLETLDLGFNELSGSIPPSLGNLSHLKTLDLSINKLIGVIPPQLSSLTSLTKLAISGNKITGTIPAQLSLLTNLKELYLGGNQLYGTIPSELGNMTGLTALSLGQNQLVGAIPAELGNLTSLKSLSLYSNKLSGPLPTQLGSLTQLEHLYLEDNNFYGDVPASFTQLVNLVNGNGLDFSGNQLNNPASPLALDDFLELKNTDWASGQSKPLSFCSLVIDIPLAECQALAKLYHSTHGYYWTQKTNWLTAANAGSWYGVTVSSGHVTALDLSANNLDGMLFSELGDLTELTSLKLNDNMLAEKLPESLSNLAKLPDNTGLNLNNNAFNTTTSKTLGDFLDLKNPGWAASQTPPFTSCDAINEIPKLECQALVALYNDTRGSEWMRSEGWLEAGKISSWAGVTITSGHVTMLNESENALRGTIPTRLGDLTSLITLDLFGNFLSGPIPSELGNLTNLENLILHSNLLSGPIPPELGNLSNLSWLMLDNNRLSGTIPSELGQLTNLTYLWLSTNQLSGPIPPELGSLVYLSNLSLAKNQLSGDVPASFTQLTDLDDEYGLDLIYNSLNTNVSSQTLAGFLNQKALNWYKYQNPKNLTAVLNNAAALLTWDAMPDPSEVDKYLVYRDGILLGQPVTPTYTDSTLSCGKTYTYTVKAYNSGYDRNSNPSNEAQVFLPCQPALSSMSAYSAPAGSSALTLNVTGSQFANDSIVRWNGSDLATTFVSATRLSAVVPAAKLASTGSASVTVYNPVPNDKTSNLLVFLVQPAANLETNSALLSPTQPGTLTFTSAANPALSASLSVPAGAVTAQTQLFFTSTPAQPGALQSGFLFGGQHFEINAFVDGQKQANFQFAQPVRLTLTYPSSLSELEASKLELRYWNGSQWSTDGISLVSRDPAKHQLVLELTHLSEFALLTSGYRTFTPLISK